MTPPVEHVPYRLLGASGRLRLQQRLEAAARRWLETWNVQETNACSVRLMPFDKPAQHSREVAAQPQRVTVGGVPALELRFCPRALGALVGVPIERFSSGESPDRSVTLAGRLSHALFRGFVNEIMDSASIENWELDDATNVGSRSANAQAAACKALVAAGERELVWLELAPLLINALVPVAAAPAAPRFDPCRKAIAAARVRVAAELGGADLSVSDFMSLERGDVIVLDARIGDTCKVAIPGVALVADAIIGKRGDFRAVRIRQTDGRQAEQ